MTEVIDKLEAIIHLQSDVIDELFRLLDQYMSVDELDSLPAINKIYEAAQLRRWYEEA